MNTDRVSAWFDDELDKAELETLHSDFSSKELQSQYFVYHSVHSAMRGSQDAADYMDHSPAISKLLSKLDEEPSAKKTVLDQMKSFINLEPLVYSLKQNLVPFIVAVAAVSVVIFSGKK